MDELFLYGEGERFDGSMDAEGCIYDPVHHRYLGRIDGNVVYDMCNIPIGRIDEDGCVWDSCEKLIGTGHGGGFCGPLGESAGLVRDMSDSGKHGSYYGALLLLKERCRENWWMNPNGLPDKDEKVDSADDGSSCDNPVFETKSRPAPPRRRTTNKKLRLKDADVKSHLVGLGCSFLILLFVFLVFCILIG